MRDDKRAPSRIDNEDHLAAGLRELLAIAPDLGRLAAAGDPLPLRRHPPTFAELARIVTAQQVSLASAAAIYGRLETLIAPFDAATILRLSDDQLGQAGLSRAKIATFRAIAEAVADGLDLAGLVDLPAEDARARLVSLRGIGPWTADVFLLFCAGHPDVFPAGDVALQEALRDALALDVRPNPREAERLARRWSPWRGVAARLLWAHYRRLTGRGTGLPV
ncbi:DNA-3-methyladenine glycosylase 2 family protein [Stappia sp. WLB 29]|uniref:DNA-3-methyladenine glycosylase family protein n=1 Tax=Stappia sp. WLB 29 TaxID=2925220 RepID=UPI0020BDB6AE|nr:DNA-3-methyladenine glycosylase 2 family protein [Stappia sp. WLB 29]